MKNNILLVFIFTASLSVKGQTHLYGDGPVKTLLLDDGKTAVTASWKGFYLKFWDIYSGVKTGEVKLDYINDFNLNSDQSKIVLINTAYQKKERVLIDIISKTIIERINTKSDEAIIPSEPNGARKFTYTHGYADKDKQAFYCFRANLEANESQRLERFSYFFKVEKKDDYLSEPKYDVFNNSIIFEIQTKKGSSLYRKACDSDSSPEIIYSSPNPIYLKEVSPDGVIAITNNEQIIDLKKGELIGTMDSELIPAMQHDVYFDTENSRFLVYANHDQRVELFDYNGKLVIRHKLNITGKDDFRITHNFKTNQLAYASPFNQVHIIDLVTGEKRIDLKESNEAVENVAAAAKSGAELMEKYMEINDASLEKMKAENKVRPDIQNHESLFEQSGFKVYKRINSYSNSGGGSKLAKVSVILLNDSGAEKSGKFLLAYSDGIKAEGQVIDFCLSNTAGKELTFMSKEVTPNITKIEIKEFSIKNGCN